MRLWPLGCARSYARAVPTPGGDSLCEIAILPVVAGPRSATADHSRFFCTAPSRLPVRGSSFHHATRSHHESFPRATRLRPRRRLGRLPLLPVLVTPHPPSAIVES